MFFSATKYESHVAFIVTIIKKRTYTLLYALFYAIDISTLPSGKIMPKSTS